MPSHDKGALFRSFAEMESRHSSTFEAEAADCAYVNTKLSWFERCTDGRA
jgi:hypothetical protein